MFGDVNTEPMKTHVVAFDCRFSHLQPFCEDVVGCRSYFSIPKFET